MQLSSLPRESILRGVKRMLLPVCLGLNFRRFSGHHYTWKHYSVTLSTFDKGECTCKIKYRWAVHWLAAVSSIKLDFCTKCVLAPRVFYEATHPEFAWELSPSIDSKSYCITITGPNFERIFDFHIVPLLLSASSWGCVVSLPRQGLPVISLPQSPNPPSIPSRQLPAKLSWDLQIRRASWHQQSRIIHVLELWFQLSNLPLLINRSSAHQQHHPELSPFDRTWN